MYYGYSQPRDIFSITNGFDLFNRKLRITRPDRLQGRLHLSTIRRAQFYATNFATWYSDEPQDARRCSIRRETSPTSSAKNPRTTIVGYLENGQYWKLREVSAALTLPNAFASKIRARDAQLVFSARNLHTWTKYTGTIRKRTTAPVTAERLSPRRRRATYFLVRAEPPLLDPVQGRF